MKFFINTLTVLVFIIFAGTAFAEENVSPNYFNMAEIKKEALEQEEIKAKENTPKYAVVISMKKCKDYLKSAGLYYNKKYKACLRQKTAMADAEKAKAMEMENIKDTDNENDK